MILNSSCEFENVFSTVYLSAIYDKRFIGKNCIGIDGINADAFRKDLQSNLELISKKVLAGSYTFSPYKEKLISKGRNMAPRIISIPTIRDQLVFSALKDFLSTTLAIQIKKSHRCIGAVISDMERYSGLNRNIAFMRSDISGFYDNIDRELLMDMIRKKITEPKILKLIYQAISTITIPWNTKCTERNDYLTSKGIPQGLAISNILSEAYLQDIDDFFTKSSVLWMRYVDDILLFCDVKKLPKKIQSVQSKFRKMGLEIHEAKTKTGILGQDHFEFLGYRFSPTGTISIRDSSVQKKVSSLVTEIISTNNQLKVAKMKLSANAFRNCRSRMVKSINKKITGIHIKERLIGWNRYYSYINDVSLLYRIDELVTKACKRCEMFNNKRPKELKTFVKTFREMHKYRLGNDTGYFSYHQN